MKLHVRAQVIDARRQLTARRTLKPRSRMHSALVLAQAALIRKRRTAHVACKRFLSGMALRMRFKAVTGFE